MDDAARSDVTVSVLVTPETFSAFHRSGGPLVDAQVLEFAIEAARETAFHLVVDSVSRESPSSLRQAVDEWRRHGARVSLFPFDELQHVLMVPGTVLLASGDDAARLAAARALVRQPMVPICALMYSMLWPDVLIRLLAVNVLTSSRDCLVVPSVSGRKIVDFMLDMTADLRPHERTRPSIVEIPYGVSTDVFGTTSRDSARARLGLPAGSFVVGYVGRLTNVQKADLDPLLVVTRRLLENGIPATLLLAGSEQRNMYRQELERKAIALGLAPHLFILPEFSDDEKAAIYSACDVCVFPSDNIQETFGISVIEAMASGVPVVASRWSGYRDLVRDGKTGFLVDTAFCPSRQTDDPLLFARRFPAAGTILAARTLVDVEALESTLLMLARSPELRAALGAEGRRVAKAEYSWPTVIRRFHDLWMAQARDGGDLGLHGHADAQTTRLDRMAPDLMTTFGASVAPLSFSMNEASRTLLASAHDAAWDFIPEAMRPAASECLRRLSVAEIESDGQDKAEFVDAAVCLAKKGLVKWKPRPRELATTVATLTSRDRHDCSHG